MHNEQNTFWVTMLLLVGGALMWHFDPGSADTVKLGWAAVVGHWLGRNGNGKAASNGGSASGS